MAVIRPAGDPAAHLAAPPAIDRVVCIHEEAAVHVDEEDGVLIVIGDALHSHFAVESHPLLLGQHLHLVAHFFEVISDALAMMVG